MKRPYEFIVPAHGSVEVKGILTAYREGPLEIGQTVFVDDHGVRPIVFTVRAVGVKGVRVSK